MQQARHTGKLVLTLPPDGPLPVRPDASYLISGGLSGVGLETAKWLARQGAGQLLLLGRRAPSPEVESQLAELRALGTVVTAVQADVSDWEQVERALTGVDPAFSLAGIIHAAGVLDDGALLQQSWPRFLRVFAPKVQGALNLHRLSQGQALDFFVCFSSVASLLGTAGQANYAAANAFLDAFAHARRAQGEPFLAVNWGAWAEVGMAAAQVARSGAEMARRGEGAIAPAEGVEIFAHLLGGEAAQMGVLPFAWERYLQQSGREQPFYNGLRTATPAAAVQQAAPARLRQQLAESEASQRPGLLMAQLQQSAAKILGMGDGVHFDPGVGLMQMGFDSLMAVELRNQLSRTLELSLPATLIFDYPTLRKLRDYLLERLDVLANGVPVAAAVPASESQREAVLNEDIALLSDDDLMAQIDAAFARRQ
jgi:myxalamid-type polyketide synthase MxaB